MRTRELNTIADMVKDILINDEKARNSDDYLYHQVCASINSDVLALPFGHVLTNLNTYNVPCFESVNRARRKVQAQFPDLKAVKEVQQGRLENEIQYEEFARSEVR
jgi:hypothetical protein